VAIVYSANIENCGNCWVPVYLDRQNRAFHGINPELGSAMFGEPRSTVASAFARHDDNVGGSLRGVRGAALGGAIGGGPTPRRGAGLGGAIVDTDKSRRLPGLLRTTAVDPKQPCRGFRQPLPAGLDRTFGMQIGI
jgi:hypothetical protein